MKKVIGYAEIKLGFLKLKLKTGVGNIRNWPILLA
jgi:hypothetical protein